MATYTSGVYQTSDISAADHTHEFTSAGGGGVGAGNIFYVAWLETSAGIQVAGLDGVTVGSWNGLTIDRVDGVAGTPFTAISYNAPDAYRKYLEFEVGAGSGSWMICPSPGISAPPASSLIGGWNADSTYNLLGPLHYKFTYGQSAYDAGWYNPRSQEDCMIGEGSPVQLVIKSTANPNFGDGLSWAFMAHKISD